MNSEKSSVARILQRCMRAFSVVRANLASFWHNIPPKWRRKIISWLVPIAVGQIVILVWGPGVWLVLLITVSFCGWVLRQSGFRPGGRVDGLLGKVWDYFMGSILFALLPALWQALKSMAGGDIIGGLIQLAVLTIIAVIVYEKFAVLPRSWTRFTSQKPRKAHRR